MFPGHGLPAAAARAALRATLTQTAQRAGDEAGFFAGLRSAGVLVRLRFSDTHPGQVTGYAVGLPGHNGRDGELLWYGGGRLSAVLTLPRLRRRWDPARTSAREQSSAAERSGAFGCTVPERDAIYRHAARQAAAAADHIRRCAQDGPDRATDAAWAAADTLHVAARALRNPALRRAADSYDRAARAWYGQIPRATREGSRLRAAARLMALAGQATGEDALVMVALIANLAAMAAAVAELRQSQQHAAQAAAARAAASQLHAACVRDRSPALRQHRVGNRQYNRPQTPADHAHGDFPARPGPGLRAPVVPGRPGPATRPGTAAVQASWTRPLSPSGTVSGQARFLRPGLSRRKRPM